MRWTAPIVSVAVHAALILIAIRAGNTETSFELPAMAPIAPRPMEVTMIDVIADAPKPASSGGGGGGHPHHGARAGAPTNPWHDLTVSAEQSGGGGGGTGAGGFGTGSGIGFGNGGGVHSIGALPAVPAPFVSKARPAKLLHPTRQTEVDDDELFEAKITVDTTGDVVGAHMIRTHPGSHGEVASSMIWQFRYSPALDDDGSPVTSTFVQTFAVR